ncbi:hypothetical protein AKJ58_00115 [candidate division MSBL1 archaeon SCGC-AAA385D11]|uniref:Sialidase domain-containing protein n=1 Tax=candidate division MSBL1 archaeon SCGC-AAA385D11 TaxID=1698286 RepID=A0A133VPH2_9EURY|nr:hypothetical protein AKJ58_00115 [candidate division MSBL1 archaeon SCGC-AAA385D11]
MNLGKISLFVVAFLGVLVLSQGVFGASIKVEGLSSEDINATYRDNGVNFQTSYLNKTVNYSKVIKPDDLRTKDGVQVKTKTKKNDSTQVEFSFQVASDSKYTWLQGAKFSGKIDIKKDECKSNFVNGTLSSDKDEEIIIQADSHYEHLILNYSLFDAGILKNTSENVYSGEETKKIPISSKVERVTDTSSKQEITYDNLYESADSKIYFIAHEKGTNITNIDFKGLGHKTCDKTYSSYVVPKVDEAGLSSIFKLDNISNYEFACYNVSFPENSKGTLEVYYEQPPKKGKPKEFSYYSYLLGSAGAVKVGISSGWATSGEARAICRDGKSNVHMVWRNDSSTIKYANSSDNGNTWTVNSSFYGSISDSTSTKANHPIGISCDGNNITVVYSDNYASNSYAVIVGISEDNGKTWSWENPVNATNVGWAGEAVERRGNNIYVAYTGTGGGDTYDDIWFINSTDGGNTWGPSKKILDTFGADGVNEYDFEKPTMSVSEDGNRIYLGAFDFYPASKNIKGKVSEDGGGSWSGYKTILTDPDLITGYYSSITSKGRYAYATVKRTPGAETADILYSYSTDNGSSWSSTSVISPSGGTDEYPSITINGNGYPTVFWIRDGDVVYREHNRTGWESLNTITSAGTVGTVNTKWRESEGLMEYVYNNGSSAPYDILYENITSTDTIKPSFSNRQTDVVSVFSSPPESKFNITWEDANEIDTSLFESNYSSSPKNYSVSRISGDKYDGTYNYNTVLPAGTFYWKSYANDSSGQDNSTSKYHFTIDPSWNQTTNIVTNKKYNISRNADYFLEFAVNKTEGSEEQDLTYGSDVNTQYLNKSINLTNFDDVTDQTMNGTWSTNMNGTCDYCSDSFSLSDNSWNVLEARSHGDWITDQLSNTSIYNDTVVVGKKVKAHYNISGQNTGVNFTGVQVEANIPFAFYSNVTPYVFTDDITSGSTYSHNFINLTGIPVPETSWSLTKGTVPNYDKYTYTASLDVRDGNVSSHKIKYVIPKDRLSNWFDRDTTKDEYKVDGQSSGLEHGVVGNNLIINVTTGFGSSSLESGSHEASVVYYVETTGGGGGGVAKVEVPSFIVSPEELNVRITREEECLSKNLTYNWAGIKTQADVSVYGDIKNVTVTPQSGDLLLLRSDEKTTLPVKFCIPERLRQAQKEVIKKGWSGSIGVTVSVPSLTKELKVPVTVKLVKKKEKKRPPKKKPTPIPWKILLGIGVISMIAYLAVPETK